MNVKPAEYFVVVTKLAQVIASHPIHFLGALRAVGHTLMQFVQK
jgi:hypothetical protein